MSKHRTSTRPFEPRGFSLTELLAVVALIALLALIAVPALTSLVYSTQRSLADNQLRVGLTAGRDAAIRSESGDGAAVFFFENGRIRIVPYVSVGAIDDLPNDGSTDAPGVVRREVFVPVPGVEPIEMPSGWSVRGFAPPGSLHTAANFNGWYEWLGTASASLANEPNWVFPETSFFDEEQLGNGWKRQTFMVRFEAQSGNLSGNNTDIALIVAPSVDDTWRVGPPYNNARLRLDASLDLTSSVRRITADTTLSTGALPTIAQRLVGDISNDTILARPVTEIALYDEERMGNAIGATRLNRATRTMYGDPAQPNFPPLTPQYDTTLVPGANSAEKVQRRINQWIVGDPTDLPAGVVSESRIFSLVRYLGQVQEVSP